MRWTNLFAITLRNGFTVKQRYLRLGVLWQTFRSTRVPGPTEFLREAGTHTRTFYLYDVQLCFLNTRCSRIGYYDNDFEPNKTGAFDSLLLYYSLGSVRTRKIG